MNEISWPLLGAALKKTKSQWYRVRFFLSCPLPDTRGGVEDSRCGA